MARRNWVSRIYSFTPLTGNANSVYLGSPDPSTTLVGTNHNIIEMEGHFDQVQLILGNMSTVDDQVILGANAIAPNSIVDHVQDAAFATAQSFTFSGSSGVTVPKRSGVAYPTVVFSDPMNISSVDRVDVVGARPLLGFRVLTSLPSGNTTNVSYFLKVGADWGIENPIGWHKSVSGNVLSSALGVTPASSGVGCSTAVLGVRYLARNRSMTVMWIGDSLTACAAGSYTDKKYGGFPLNSAIANSSLSNPVEVINCGMSSQSATQYQQAATYLMPIVYPTHIVHEFLSPNTLSPGSIASGIATCVTEQATVFTNAATIGAVRSMWGGIPECTSAACTTSVYSAAEDLTRIAAMATQAALGYPYLNLNDVIRTNTAPQLIQSTSNGYATDFSADGLHPNQAADDQQLTPAATTFVASLLSSYLASFPTEYQVRIPGGGFANLLSGYRAIRVPGGAFLSEREAGGAATMGGPGRRMSMGLMIGIT